MIWIFRKMIFALKCQFRRRFLYCQFLVPSIFETLSFKILPDYWWFGITYLIVFLTKICIILHPTFGNFGIIDWQYSFFLLRSLITNENCHLLTWGWLSKGFKGLLVQLVVSSYKDSESGASSVLTNFPCSFKILSTSSCQPKRKYNFVRILTIR